MLGYKEMALSRIEDNQYGIIFILDALGASTYSNEKIKHFLFSRKLINDYIMRSNKEGQSFLENEVETYTFGDTVIVAIPIENRLSTALIISAAICMMSEYLFASLGLGILYRGAFSIGNYISDRESNTVMGEAVTDAAAWYEKSEWMGVSSTPGTNNVLEYELMGDLKDIRQLVDYPVPMKDKRKLDLYTIAWPLNFLDIADVDRANKDFLSQLIENPIPFGTEQKIINTKTYFSYIEKELFSKD